MQAPEKVTEPKRATSSPYSIQTFQPGQEDGQIIDAGFYRSNIRYEVIRVTNEAEKKQQLAQLLKETEGTGIIYASTIRNVEAVTDYLKGLGFDVARYHGKLGKREREENQQRFINGELKAMAAINIFGPSIDKPDISFVVHYNMPGSLDAYYQETSCAGRDGKPARCTLLYQPEDRRIQSYLLGGRHPDADEVLNVCNALERLGADKAAIRLSALQQATDAVAKTKTRVILSLLKEAGLVKEGRGAQFQLLKTGLQMSDLAELGVSHEDRTETDQEKLERMIAYAQSALCRWKLILGYFGAEIEWQNCSHCDNCLHPVQQQMRPPKDPDRLRFTGLPSIADKRAKEKSIEKGDSVTLPKYGTGEVQAIEGDKLVINFPDYGIKKIKCDWLLQ